MSPLSIFDRKHTIAPPGYSRMYGGGFSTIPTHLRDVVGAMHVGAIHGRPLTAWSAAGVFGPVIVNYMREYQIESGVPKA